MKNLTLLSVLSVTVLFSTPLFGQIVSIDTMCWVSVNHPDAVPLTDGSPTTSDADLNTLFSNYDVVYYGLVFPGARTPMLQNRYKIVCDGCEIDSLIKKMDDDFAHFSGFRKHEYENIVVHDPEDYMWQLTMSDPDEWLWHLKKIQADLAWDITLGDPNIVIGIIDTYFDLTHPDLESKFVEDYDPYDTQLFNNCTLSTIGSFGHGTSVASFAGAETIAEGGTSNSGQLASVGFKTMLLGYKAWSGNYLERAWHAATIRNVDVLTSSAGGWSYCPDPTGEDEAVVKEILDRGTVIVMPAGNGNNGAHNTCTAIDPSNHTAFFPLSPYYDDRIILVTSTDKEDRHSPVGAHPDNVHSHYPMVDLCAPGYNVLYATHTQCGTNGWPYGSSSGTSYATPIVAGTAALILSVNPCLSPADVEYILKTTTDPVVDAASFTGLIGTGRVNAYEAVLEATTYGDVAPITSNTTWSGDRYVKGTVTVQSGTLTITGTVRMAEGAEILVESGAKLVVNGGILTSSSGCSAMWEGIEVEDGAELVITGDALIEDAVTGVYIAHGADYTIENSIFNRNYIHVVVFNNSLYSPTYGPGTISGHTSGVRPQRA